MINYCKTDEFRGAFGFADFVIVHLDADWLQTENARRDWDVPPQLHTWPPEKVVAFTRDRLITTMGGDFYSTRAHQIIFAIAVDEIECWFLGIYFGNEKKKAAKTTGCTDLLNTVLPQRENFFIKEKPVENYRKMCKHFKKKADLEKHSQFNASFRLFLEEVRDKLGTTAS